ncbi:quinone oxidoreductase [Actinomadura logoneensis]|uniref:Quinone oxidoreductase n=1 Tax=Actinomadura logoneensis TaxID=2293572 RepID=A0A372JM62_9ACTN|nr:quinone oxidoreductase [Actinomadura logoneensis]RFU41097.1 quinone oxidoreductase [Actinomadura logoneensis]
MQSTAIVVREQGGPDVLRPEQVDVPDPGEGQALVEVAYAGVNFLDIYQREGRYPMELPYVPGGEGSGRVVAVGEGVTEVKAGDRVAWESVPGSYARHVVAPAARLLPVADGVDDAQAAALPLQGLTAHYLATESHPVRAGETVLVHAGAGGTGLVLTQVLKILGATVVTTVSTEEKAKLSRAAGADHVLVGYDGFDERVRELTGGAGAHAVYDGVGLTTFDRSLAAVRPRGTLVLFGGASGPVPPVDPMRLSAAGSIKFTRPTLMHFVADPAELRARYRDVVEWAAQGRLTLRVHGEYPLEEAARAHRDLAGRGTTGKLLLRTA